MISISNQLTVVLFLLRSLEGTFYCWTKWADLLQQGALWEAEGAVGDAVHKVKWDPLHLVTVEHHEVVLEDQEREFCDENNALLFIVPVIHSETTKQCVSKNKKKNRTEKSRFLNVK